MLYVLLVWYGYAGLVGFQVTVSSGTVFVPHTVQVKALDTNYAVLPTYTWTIRFELTPMSGERAYLPAWWTFTFDTIHSWSVTLQDVQWLRIDRQWSYTLRVIDQQTQIVGTTSFDLTDGTILTSPTSGMVYDIATWLMIQGTTPLPNATVAYYLNDRHVSTWTADPFGRFGYTVQSWFVHGANTIHVKLFAPQWFWLATSNKKTFLTDLKEPFIKKVSVTKDVDAYKVDVTTDELTQCKRDTEDRTYTTMRYAIWNQTQATAHTDTIRPWLWQNTMYVRCIDSLWRVNTTSTSVSFLLDLAAPTLTTPLQYSSLSWWEVAFRWDHSADVARIEKFRIHLSRNQEFSNIIHVTNTGTGKAFSYTLTQTGVYYRKVTVYDVKGDARDSLTWQFYINDYLGSVVPDALDVALLWETTTFTDHAIPMSLTYMKQWSVDTSYNWSVRLLVQDATNTYISPWSSYVFWSWSIVSIQKWVWYIWDILRFLRVWTYTVTLHDVDHPSLKKQFSFTIKKPNTLLFDHMYGVTPGSVVQSPVVTFYDIQDNTELSRDESKASVFVNNQKEQSPVFVDQADAIYVTMQAPSAGQKTASVLLYMWTTPYAFVVSTHTLQDLQSSIFYDTTYQVSWPIRQKIVDLVSWLMTSYKQKWLSLSRIQSIVLQSISKRRFVYQYIKDTTSHRAFKNQSAFFLSVFEVLESAIKDYDATGIVYKNEKNKFTCEIWPGRNVQQNTTHVVVLDDDNDVILSITPRQNISRKISAYVDDQEKDMKKIIWLPWWADWYRLDSLARFSRTFGLYQSILLSRVYKDDGQQYAHHIFYLKNDDIVYEVSYDSRSYDLYKTQIEAFKSSFRMTN